MNKSPLSDVFGIFNKLTPTQRIIIGAVTLSTIILLGIFVNFLNEPNFGILYTNLNNEDAADVIEYLNSQKIIYKIEGNGTTIKIPSDFVYETRLTLASKGVPNSGLVGYEVFDNGTMGMSEFMQKLNYRRALEGELARTIMQQDGIEGARVHIVIPAKSIFKDEEKSPTASVVLKLGNNARLSQSNIASILNLVASSVEGLNQSKITLIDTKGRLLSRNEDENSLLVATSKQYELQKSVENYLTTKAQSLLDNVLGYGNAIIQVNTDLNFDQVERTLEQYDPETQVAISEQTVKSENTGINFSDSTAYTSQNNIVNYEISKSIEKVIQGTGNIKKLSVAAVINDIPKETVNGNKTEIVFQPRSEEQLRKLEMIIRNAVGVDNDRGDSFSIVNIPFEQSHLSDINIEHFEDETGVIPKDMDKLLNLVMIILAIGASLYLVRGLMQKLKNERIIIGTYDDSMMGGELSLQGASDSGNKNIPMQTKKRRVQLPLGNIEDELSDEAIRKQTQQERIANYVSKNPFDAAKLINSWLHEDEF